MKKVAFIVCGVLLGLILSVSLFANEMPTNCKSDQIRAHNRGLILHTTLNHEPQLVILNNKSKFELLVNHVVVYPSASAGWSSYLRSGNYSALMVSQPKFSLVCHKIEGDKYIQVDCDKVLTACYFSHFRDEQKAATGTYWVIENKSLEDVMQGIQSRKIFVNTPN